MASDLPGVIRVYACPGGAVSVTEYSEWSTRDPTKAVEEALRGATVPPSLVRRRDLRPATRHGPELGRAAERFLARGREPRPIHVVYWRLYPFQRGKVPYHLFACFRHGSRSVRFYVAPTESGSTACPDCAR